MATLAVIKVQIVRLASSLDTSSLTTADRNFVACVLEDGFNPGAPLDEMERLAALCGHELDYSLVGQDT